MRKKGDQPVPPERSGLQPLGGPAQRRDRIWAGAFAAGVHLVVLCALLWPKHNGPAVPAESSLTLISLDVSKPPGPPAPAAAESEASNTVPPPTPMQVRAPVFVVAAVPDNSDLLSESQIAGAASAGEGAGGGGGGTCDLARAVQQALRRDPLVHTAVQNANRQGKAVMMWNGDWVRSGAQDGKGLSAVREAIMWAVAFAPETCRNEPMRGLVMMSLADGSTRFAIGAGTWRWSDLLGIRRNPPVR
jgi:hypothetical protein